MEKYIQLLFTYTTYFLPLLLFIVVYIVFHKKPLVFSIASLTIVLLFALTFKENENDDLFRYFTSIESYRLYGLDYVKAIHVRNSNESYLYGSFVYQHFLYFLSLFPNWVTKVVPPIIVYFNILIVTWMICKDNRRASCFPFFCLASFLTISLYSSISSWHYMLTISILAMVIYQDLIKKRFRFLCFLIYIFLCFFHVIALSIFIMRIIVFLFKKVHHSEIIIPVLFIFWRSLISTFSTILYGFASNHYVAYVLLKIESYSIIGEESIQPFYLIPLFLLLLSFLYLLLINKQKTKKPIKLLLGCLIGLALGSVGSLNVVFRYAHLAIILMPFFYVDYFKEDCNVIKIKQRSQCLSLICMFSVFLAFSLAFTQYYPLSFLR